jgi:AraC-like DNA-binding protein
MDCSLVRHAHPHCHVLLKVAGADTQFVVGNRIHALTDSAAVLVDGWQPYSYVHDPARPRTLILLREVSVGEVGARLGFSRPRAFHPLFRNNAGVSPSEFRQISRLAS